jgi:hypothetical protein
MERYDDTADGPADLSREGQEPIGGADADTDRDPTRPNDG